MLRLQGNMVRFTQKPWQMDGRAGVTRTARVIVGMADFVDVKVPDTMPDPYEGQVVDWAIRPGVNNGKLSLLLEGDYTSVVHSAPGASLASSKT